MGVGKHALFCAVLETKMLEICFVIAVVLARASQLIVPSADAVPAFRMQIAAFVSLPCPAIGWFPA